MDLLGGGSVGPCGCGPAAAAGAERMRPCVCKVILNVLDVPAVLGFFAVTVILIFWHGFLMFLDVFRMFLDVCG